MIRHHAWRIGQGAFKQCLILAFGTISTVLSAGLLASEAGPDRGQLVGQYIRGAEFDVTRLKLSSAGVFHQTFHPVAPFKSESSTGTWRLDKGWLILRRTTGDRIYFDRFYILADGKSWALLPEFQVTDGHRFHRPLPLDKAWRHPSSIPPPSSY